MIKTNYGTGPYRIESIIRGCACVHALDECNGIDEKLPPHCHLRLRDPEDGLIAWLNYYDEETLESVAPNRTGMIIENDRLILLPNTQPIQQTLI